MIRRQKIGNLILGTVVHQSARADVRRPIVVEYNSCNGIFLGCRRSTTRRVRNSERRVDQTGVANLAREKCAIPQKSRILFRFRQFSYRTR